ncbi:MAG: hypothetical protein MJZ00_05260 [Paludibacteraceae bacterium]|nr:hypothetical protein [Paludibacteraceae bacterium]
MKRRNGFEWEEESGGYTRVYTSVEKNEDGTETTTTRSTTIDADLNEKIKALAEKARNSEKFTIEQLKFIAMHKDDGDVAPELNVFRREFLEHINDKIREYRYEQLEDQRDVTEEWRRIKQEAMDPMTAFLGSFMTVYSRNKEKLVREAKYLDGEILKKEMGQRNDAVANLLNGLEYKEGDVKIFHIENESGEKVYVAKDKEEWLNLAKDEAFRSEMTDVKSQSTVYDTDRETFSKIEEGLGKAENKREYLDENVGEPVMQKCYGEGVGKGYSQKMEQSQEQSVSGEKKEADEAKSETVKEETIEFKEDITVGQMWEKFRGYEKDGSLKSQSWENSEWQRYGDQVTVEREFSKEELAAIKEFVKKTSYDPEHPNVTMEYDEEKKVLTLSGSMAYAKGKVLGTDSENLKKDLGIDENTIVVEKTFSLEKEQKREEEIRKRIESIAEGTADKRDLPLIREELKEMKRSIDRQIERSGGEKETTQTVADLQSLKEKAESTEKRLDEVADKISEEEKKVEQEKKEEQEPKMTPEEEQRIEAIEKLEKTVLLSGLGKDILEKEVSRLEKTLEKYGQDVQGMKEDGRFEKLLNGEKVRLEAVGHFEFDMAVNREKSGKLGVMVGDIQMKDEANIPEEARRLAQNDQGKYLLHYMDSNERIAWCAVRESNLPKQVNGHSLTSQEKIALLKGESIVLTDCTEGAKTPYTAEVHMNLEKKGKNVKPVLSVNPSEFTKRNEVSHKQSQQQQRMNVQKHGLGR